MKRLSANLIATLFAWACLDASAADSVKPACVQPAIATTTAKSDAEPRGQAPGNDGTAAVSSVGNLAGGAGGGAAAASYAKTAGPNAGMPNRISMKVKVPKQTQGATFGEKVNQGLHAAGSALGQGAAATSKGGTDCDDTDAAARQEKAGQSDASAGAGTATAAGEVKTLAVPTPASGDK